MTDGPEPAFTPEEEAHFERLKEEHKVPLKDRIPRSWLYGLAVGVAAIAGFIFYLVR